MGLTVGDMVGAIDSEDVSATRASSSQAKASLAFSVISVSTTWNPSISADVTTKQFGASRPSRSRDGRLPAGTLRDTVILAPGREEAAGSPLPSSEASNTTVVVATSHRSATKRLAVRLQSMHGSESESEEREGVRRHE